METRPGTRLAARGARAALLVALSGSLLAGCASRGAITGRVRTPGPEARDVVVMAWLDDGTTAPPADARAGSGHGRVVQAKGGFEPRVLVVQAGTTVEFENQDRLFHKLFSVSPAARFSLGAYRPGDRRTSPFTRAGVVQVYCELHPREVLHVVVVPDRWHTRPGADGQFRLTSLPHGRYVLRAWHPTFGQVTRHVEVPTREKALLSFVN